MKRFILIMILPVLTLPIMARAARTNELPDSVFIRKIGQLETSIKQLRYGDWNHQKKIDQLVGQLESLKNDLAQVQSVAGQAAGNAEKLRSELARHQASSEERFKEERDWSRKMFLWFFIIFGTISLALVFLAIMDRGRISRGLLKLESKIDGTGKSLDQQISQLSRAHQDDVQEIRSAIEQLKKKE